MSTDTNVVQQLLDYMEKHKVTQAAVARGIGISPAAVNQILQGKYEAGTANIEHKIKSYLQRELDRKDISLIKGDFIPTYFSGRILDTCRFSHLEAEVSIVIGDAGLGKTTAVKQYALRNTDVILVEADPGYNARAILEDILSKLNGETGHDLHRMMTDVVSKLKGSGRMIIVDEAENLPHKALETIRRIYDKAEIGVVLSGMPTLLSNLRGRRGEYAQLYSRVGRLTNLNHIRSEMADALEEDSALYVETMLPGANGHWKALHNASKGNPRVLVKLIRRSQRICEVNQVKLSQEVIQSASDMLMFGGR
ncbi:MAG: AAA family ATPase [Bacteroidetes bacterium]|nr:AAA family ATPase [Bacteroidota bacterium]